jgi:hypothetical protein
MCYYGSCIFFFIFPCLWCRCCMYSPQLRCHAVEFSPLPIKYAPTHVALYLDFLMCSRLAWTFALWTLTGQYMHVVLVLRHQHDLSCNLICKLNPTILSSLYQTRRCTTGHEASAYRRARSWRSVAAHVNPNPVNPR